MTSNYPSAIDSFVNPGTSDYEDVISHAGQHSNANDAIEAVEAVLGTTAGSAVLSDFPSGDKAVSITGTVTLRNKTLGTGSAISLGSDATGDMYYRNTGGSLSRIPIGSTGQVLTTNGTTPSWGSGASEGWSQFSGTLSLGTGGTSNAPVYLITAPGTFSTSISEGMKFKFDQSGTTRYGYVAAAPALSSGTTTFSVYIGTAAALGTSAISNPYYSAMRSPYAWPAGNAYWTVERTDGSELLVNSPTAGTWSAPGTVSITIPIGKWNVGYTVYSDAQKTTNQFDQQISLSTSTTSESDARFTTAFRGYDRAGAKLYIESSLALTSNTVYYLITRTTVASLNYIDMRGDSIQTRIFATSAYQ